MHAVNPVQRLRLLRDRARAPDRRRRWTPESAFHAEMSEIFHSVRDLHTNYLLPEPYAGKIAFLPFLIEEYLDERRAERYLVIARRGRASRAPAFGAGAEVTHWNGIPIDRAVERQRGPLRRQQRRGAPLPRGGVADDPPAA